MVSKLNFSFFVLALSLLSAQIINVVANPINMNNLAVNGQYAKRDRLGDKVQIFGNAKSAVKRADQIGGKTQIIGKPKPAVKRADKLGGSSQNHLPKPAEKRAESMGVKGDSAGKPKSAIRRADEIGGRVKSMTFVKREQQ